jgi:hypothetical protein
MVNGCPTPTTNKTQKNPDKVKQEKLFVYLQTWHNMQWKEVWQSEWPMFNSVLLISNSDLQSIAKHAEKICCMDDMLDKTCIVYYEEVSEGLYQAFTEAWELEFDTLLLRKLTNKELLAASTLAALPTAPVPPTTLTLSPTPSTALTPAVTHTPSKATPAK